MVENWKHFNGRYHTGWVLLWKAGCIIFGWIRSIFRRILGRPAEKQRRKKGWGYY